MAEIVKTCDLCDWVAANLFAMLNHDKVLVKRTEFGLIIETDTAPNQLRYPEGWYYAKGNFRNKHNSTTGLYYEVPMLKTNGDFWDEIYCTNN